MGLVVDGLTLLARGLRRRQWVPKLFAGVLVALVVLAAAVLPSAALASTATYSATETIPVPPASSYAGSGGGDGWAVALSSTNVYNVFHHDGILTVACHLQSDASSCWNPETITDASGNSFASSGHPGLYLDQSTGKLYVYATRTSDRTGGVVCFDTTQAGTNPDPFCGFTALTQAGEADTSFGWSAISDPMRVGSKWYAFNYFTGSGVVGTKNELLCFDLAADAACSGQPFSISIGTGTVASSAPSPATAAIGSELIIPINVGGADELACFDGSAQTGCAGSWPVTASFGYNSSGAPFPMLGLTGNVTGFCIPDGAEDCFGLDGTSQATPPGMAGVIGGSDPWNGASLAVGPRVYVPNGNANDVECFDYSTDSSCANFPKSFNGLGYLYTVNPDPQRPTCIWVNADNGAGQIQNFDAYTGGACGQGPIRVLASSLVAPTSACTPLSYSALQVTSPAPSTYTNGTVAFEDSDGAPIAGVAAVQLDGTGTASLSGLNLNSATGLPEFLITLTGASGSPGSVVVQLTWVGSGPYNAACVVGTPTATNGYTALGDSFSSGEGNPPFLQGTATSTDACHRSYVAYPELLQAMSSLNLSNMQFVACSGATREDVIFGKYSEDSQLNHVSSSTSVVTIGVGGDDIGFANVLKQCVTGLTPTLLKAWGAISASSANCQNLPASNPDTGAKTTLNGRENALIADLGKDGSTFCVTPGGYISCSPRLATLYYDIANLAPNAKILVLLYPHLFNDHPPNGGCTVGYGAKMSYANMVWLNSGVNRLDSEIQTEVDVASAAGINVSTVDPRQIFDADNGPYPDGHGICTSDPWIYDIYLRGTSPGPYSFHPNEEGQAAFAAQMVGHLP